MLYPREKALSYCKKKCGGVCSSETCVIEDDFGEIAEKLAWADTVVLATPIYYNKPSKNFKMILDRSKVLANGRFDKKGIVLIVTAGMKGEAPAQQTIELVKAWCAGFRNTQLKDVLYETGLNKIDDAKGSAQEMEAFELGKTCE